MAGAGALRQNSAIRCHDLKCGRRNRQSERMPAKKVFINYPRQDSRYQARMIFDALLRGALREAAPAIIPSRKRRSRPR